MPGLIETLAASLDLLGLVLLTGVTATWWWLAPAGAPGPMTEAPRRLFWTALLLMTAGAGLELLLRTATLHEMPLAQSWRQAGDVLLGSDFGRFWMLRAAPLGLLMLAGLIVGHRIAILRTLGAATVLLTAFALSATGHGGEAGSLTVLALSTGIHVISAGLWAGAVLLYGLALAPRMRGGRVPAAWVAESAQRLSALAGLALALVLASGLYNAWALLGSLPALWQTRYGQVLIVKLVFVGLMVLIGWINRYEAVPAIRAWARPPQLVAAADAPLRRLQSLLRIDAVAVLGAVMAAAVLGNVGPPAHG